MSWSEQSEAVSSDRVSDAYYDYNLKPRSLAGKGVLIMFRVNLLDVYNEILAKTREVEVAGGSEEDLKIRIEQVLRDKVWNSLGVPSPRYEYSVGVTHWGRVDALYGLTIFEYKRPNELRKESVRREAIHRLKEKYIPGLLTDKNVNMHIKTIKSKGLTPIIVGIIWDGYHVIFCEYNYETRDFRCSQLYELSPDILRRIIRTVIATYKKKIDARLLALDFGHKSRIIRKNLVVKKLYNKLLKPSEKTQKLFSEWSKLVSQAFSLSGEELRKIAEDYGFKRDEYIDGLKLFFAIQTYYALVIKMLAAEVCARFYDSSAGSFFRELEYAIAKGNLRDVLERLESGWYYTYFGVKNFLEGEFFSWYLNEWDSEIEKAIKCIIETLLEYDIESIVIDPSTARDVFKLLYEELVPRKEIRQKLGIYTTPDWLAELIIDELISMARKNGVSDEDLINTKWLDPGCGTGTFLTLIIKKLAQIGKTKLKPNELLRKICSNVIGFDIDSLAVLTARANYLIALASEGLLENKGYDESGGIRKIEIPVYLANSIVRAREAKGKAIVEGKLIEVAQVEAGGELFQIPFRILDKVIDLLNDFKEYIEAEYLPKEEIKKRYELTSAELKLVIDVYSKLLNFKRRGMDSVWIPILKSYFASTYYKDFDFIVGNPPWIAYRYIANPEYQRHIKTLIKDVYGLVTEDHLMTHMEMATLFLVSCLDTYLKDNGLLGFVMPKSIMYSDQHHNFRTQNVKRVSYKIEKLIDCEVEPLFYVPACAIIIRKKYEKSSEIPTLFLRGRLPEETHKVLSLAQALSKLEIREGKLYLNLIGTRSFYSENRITASKERSYYYSKFYQGATIVPQSCWFVDVMDWTVPLVETSKRVSVRGKVDYRIARQPIEKEFLYYVLTSAEVLPFCHLEPSIAVLPIILKEDGYHLITREDIIKGRVGIRATYLAKWLEKAEEIWRIIRGEKAGKVSIYEWLDYQHKLSNQNPNAKYIVVYLRSGTHLASCVVNNEFWRRQSKLQKPIIIESTLYRYFTDDENEAYYLTAILNSQVLDDLVKPMQSKGYSGAARDFHKKPLEFPIPKFSKENDVHTQLAKLGKKATEKAYEILPRILRQKGYDRVLKEKSALQPLQIASLRNAIRRELSDLLKEIDRLTIEVLTSTNRTRTVITLDKFIRWR